MLATPCKHNLAPPALHGSCNEDTKKAAHSGGFDDLT